MTLKEVLNQMDISERRKANFIDYHKKNPEIWEYFESFALQAFQSGKILGANCIRERIRWEIEIERRGLFKFNNNYTPIYVRMFNAKYPQFQNCFELRVLKFQVKELV